MLKVTAHGATRTILTYCSCFLASGQLQQYEEIDLGIFSQSTDHTMLSEDLKMQLICLSKARLGVVSVA